MRTLSIFLEVLTFECEVPGNLKFKPFGDTKVEVSIKNISNKKIMSVREDMLNSALTLFLFFIPTVKNFKIPAFKNQIPNLCFGVWRLEFVFFWNLEFVYVFGSVAMMAFTFNLPATFITLTTSSKGVPISATIVIETPSLFPIVRTFWRKTFSNEREFMLLLSNKKLPSALIATVTDDGATVFESDLGNGNGGEFVKVEVSIKNISNKKIMSVNDDMLNSALTLFLFFKPTVNFFKKN